MNSLRSPVNVPASLQETLLHTEQVKLLYGGLPLSIFSNALLSILLIMVIWPVVDQAHAVSWLVVMGIVLAWRAGTYIFNRRANLGNNVLSKISRFRLGVISTGIVWGVAALLLFPMGHISHQVFLAFVLAGVSAGAITSLATDRISALGFLYPALIPLLFNFVKVGGVMPWSMALMVALFLVFLSAAADRMQKNLHENMRLRAEAIEQQDAIRESEMRLRYMLDTCPTAACIVPNSGHTVLYSNLSYAALIDISTHLSGGVDPAVYFAKPDDYLEILGQIEQGGTVAERLVELKISGESKSGSKWALASCLPIRYQGEPAVLAWYHDISERIRIELMKSEFVSTVSHELRTPLTAISGALGLISGGQMGELPQPVQHMLVIAQKNSQRLNALINDLLDIEKLTAGKMHFDIKLQALMPLIEQAVEVNRTYGAERRVSLVQTNIVPEAYVQVDSQRLIQVISNLLSNAIKFSELDGKVEISVRQRDNKLRVTVTDHGAGIPEAFRAQIFQKFVQADSSDTRQKGGTGLGLAISRGLVERMGGSIDFDSIEGKGASFYFELPACPAPV